VADTRPVDLNLLKIRFPLPAIVSIMHRISGAFLFLLLPLLLYVLQHSLTSAEGFAEVQSWLHAPVVKLALLVVVWAYLHHFFMGLRYLALDVDIGVDLASARLTAKLVLVVSMLLTLWVGVWLW